MAWFLIIGILVLLPQKVVSFEQFRHRLKVSHGNVCLCWRNPELQVVSTQIMLWALFVLLEKRQLRLSFADHQWFPLLIKNLVFQLLNFDQCSSFGLSNFIFDCIKDYFSFLIKIYLKKVKELKFNPPKKNLSTFIIKHWDHFIFLE